MVSLAGELREASAALVADVRAFISPLLGTYPITTPYAAPSAFTGEPHYGIDFGTPEGTPIYAPMAAKVVRANSTDPGGGNILILQQGNIELVFAHLSSFVAGKGDTVEQGQLIGYTGSTGQVTGPHLHFEAKRSGVPFNPLDLFDPLHAPDKSFYKDKTTKTKAGQTDLLATLGNILAFVTNPENWARLFAVLGGAILALVGLYILWTATG